jgi:NAD(P)-dependent dehydrogenase (short-subunit alcohol dehydrogenase family)
MSIVTILFLLVAIFCIGFSKKTVIITGGNRGIGFSAIQQLAKTNEWNIILACRNINLGNNAIQNIPLSEGRNNIEVLPLDLASLKSVSEFCTQWKQLKRPLHVLACNAGVQHSGQKNQILRTADGFEDTVGTNHIGHFLLVDSLVDSISKQDGRIVFVGSGIKLT